MSIKIKYELPKKHVVLVYDEKVPRKFWRIAIVTGVLPSRDSEKANAILKRPINNLPN